MVTNCMVRASLASGLALPKGIRTICAYFAHPFSFDLPILAESKVNIYCLLLLNFDSCNVLEISIDKLRSYKLILYIF